MANAQKVANIFELASVAFGKLSELTLDLKIFQAQAEQTPSTSSRWTIIEMEQLKDAIARFGHDLAKIASVLETKTKTQIKHKLKSQALQEGLPEHQGSEHNPEDADDGGEESAEDVIEPVHELPSVSTVSVDRGRRKQTFSERSEIQPADPKKRRIDISPAKPVTVVRSGAIPIISRPGVPGAPIIYKMPIPGRPEFTQQRIVPASNGAAGAMRTKPASANDSKYEEYSDDEEDVEEGHYDDDDDDEEESDERYYSEEDQ